MKYLHVVVLIVLAGLLFSQEKIETEILWKRLVWIDKDKQAVEITIWYKAPQAAFARPKIYIMDEQNEQTFSSEMVESSWVQENIYTIVFQTKLPMVKGIHFMMESNTKETFLDKTLPMIPDRPNE